MMTCLRVAILKVILKFIAFIGMSILWAITHMSELLCLEKQMSRNISFKSHHDGTDTHDIPADFIPSLKTVSISFCTWL